MKKKKKKRTPVYSERHVLEKMGLFFFYLVKDIIRFFKYGRKFSEFGVTLYCGRQGGGKTISMIEYLERMRRKYPNVIIVTNFHYKYQHYQFTSWMDLFTIRNGEDGVIFCFDELQNEWSSDSFKKFAESNLLRVITQQRKQRIKIVGTSQVFTRVVKGLREQTYEVVECRTLFGRWTFNKCYNGDEYESVIDDPERVRKLKKKWRRSFVQSDGLRELYDTYQVVESMRDKDYSPRVVSN